MQLKHPLWVEKTDSSPPRVWMKMFCCSLLVLCYRILVYSLFFYLFTTGPCPLQQYNCRWFTSYNRSYNMFNVFRTCVLSFVSSTVQFLWMCADRYSVDIFSFWWMSLCSLLVPYKRFIVHIQYSSRLFFSLLLWCQFQFDSIAYYFIFWLL